MNTECKKCDDRGMITEKKNGGIYGHSCKCGKYNKIVKERFDEMMGNPMKSIENLLSYGRSRVIEKSRYDTK